MEDGFADQYDVSSDAGIGTVYSCRYSKQNKPIQNNTFLSCSACINNGQIQMYSIFSGFNGGDATAKFVMNRMVDELLKDNSIPTSLSPSQVSKLIGKKFENVAERYLMTNTRILNERLMRLEQQTESDQIAVSEINQKIRQGTTALIVLRIAKDIYVLNCGCSLALAVTRENAVQLNFNLHNKDNESEKQRIQYLGVDPNHVLNPTRAVGDLQRTHLYEECKDFSHAKGPPVISTPDVQHFKINDSWQHLILLSDGVIQNLKEVEVDDIPTEVFVRLSKDHTLTSTAQALADAFARKHLDAFITMRDDKNCCISSHREEMTVIVVKLSEEFYEKFDPTGSSLESTNATNDISYIKPYVDSTNFNSGKNYEKMKQIASK